MDKYVVLSDIADRLQVSVSTVRLLLSRGEFDSYTDYTYWYGTKPQLVVKQESIDVVLDRLGELAKSRTKKYKKERGINGISGNDSSINL